MGRGGSLYDAGIPLELPNTGGGEIEEVHEDFLLDLHTNTREVYPCERASKMSKIGLTDRQPPSSKLCRRLSTHPPYTLHTVLNMQRQTTFTFNPGIPFNSDLLLSSCFLSADSRQIDPSSRASRSRTFWNSFGFSLMYCLMYIWPSRWRLMASVAA